jgi:hypothetical protein
MRGTFSPYIRVHWSESTESPGPTVEPARGVKSIGRQHIVAVFACGGGDALRGVRVRTRTASRRATRTDLFAACPAPPWSRSGRAWGPACAITDGGRRCTVGEANGSGAAGYSRSHGLRSAMTRTRSDARSGLSRCRPLLPSHWRRVGGTTPARFETPQDVLCGVTAVTGALRTTEIPIPSGDTESPAAAGPVDSGTIGSNRDSHHPQVPNTPRVQSLTDPLRSGAEVSINRVVGLDILLPGRRRSADPQQHRGIDETPATSRGPYDLGQGRTAKAISARSRPHLTLRHPRRRHRFGCWGISREPQRPEWDWPTTGRAHPVRFPRVDLGGAEPPKAISVGGWFHTCAILDDARHRTRWGEPTTGQLGYPGVRRM